MQFLKGHLLLLSKYKDYSLHQLEKDIEKRKLIEKLIQEVVDCAYRYQSAFFRKAGARKRMEWHSRF